MIRERWRRFIQCCLGALWLLDGALQLQPFMFGPGFARTVIAPTGQGQPLPVSASVGWAAHLILAHPAYWDTVFAVVQLSLGVLLLNRRTVRWGLAGSMAWSAGVWWFGEGAGSVANGQADLLTGAPGAVLLYLLVAVTVWPRTPAGERTGTRPSLPWRLVDRVLPVSAGALQGIWAAVWWSGALLQLLPAQRNGTALAAAFTSAAGSAPGWLAAIDRSLAQALVGTGSAAAICAAVAYAVLGAAAFAPRRLRGLGLGLAGAVAIFIWVFGEAFGGLGTGQATDPNSGPLLLLLATTVAATGLQRRSPKVMATYPDDPRPVSWTAPTTYATDGPASRQLRQAVEAAHP